MLQARSTVSIPIVVGDSDDLGGALVIDHHPPVLKISAREELFMSSSFFNKDEWEIRAKKTKQRSKDGINSERDGDSESDDGLHSRDNNQVFNGDAKSPRRAAKEATPVAAGRPASASDETCEDTNVEEGPDCQQELPCVTEHDVQVKFERAPRERIGARAFRSVSKIITKECLGSRVWWKGSFRRSFPIVEVIRTYEKKCLYPDIAAGVAAGIAAIPIGMSYALLGRFPPQYGLYCQFFYSAIYMIFGTAGQVCVGTSAIEAIMAANLIASIVGWDASPTVWLDTAVGCSFMIGVIFLVARCLRLGIIANFLADSVVSGFSTGCAVTIVTSQLKYIFGLPVPRAGNVETWLFILEHLSDSHWRCVLIGRWLPIQTALTISAASKAISGVLLTSSVESHPLIEPWCGGIAFLTLTHVLNKRWLRKLPLPGSLFVMVVFISLTYFLKLNEPPHSLSVLGNIPRGFPAPTSFSFSTPLIWPVFRSSVLYSIVYFFIHTSVARSISQKDGNNRPVDKDQECLALGVCSLVGSFFQCYPVATSFTRTSIAYVAGAKTCIFNIPNLITIALAITVLTPALQYLPMAALASVVLFGAYFMMFFSEAWRLLMLFSPDFLLWSICFTVTTLLGAIEGILTSLVLSFCWILKDIFHPRTAILGRLPGTDVFRNVKVFADAKEVPGVKILQFDSPLNFANAAHFENKIMSIASLRAAQKKKSGRISKWGAHRSLSGAAVEPTAGRQLLFETQVIIIDAASISRVDITAIRMLEKVAYRLEQANKVMLFANWKGPMQTFLKKAKFYDVVPPQRCFLTLSDAASWAERFVLTAALKLQHKTPPTTSRSSATSSCLLNSTTAPTNSTGFAASSNCIEVVV